MKILSVSMFLLSIMTLSLTAASADLFKKGQPLTEIIIEENASPVETYAAKELSQWLSGIGGADIPVSTSPKEKDRTHIFIGSKWADKFADDKKYIGDTDGFAVRSENGNIYIFGTNPVGTLNGVYSFLEKNTDIIFVRPMDKLDAVYGMDPDLKADVINYHDKPVFSIRAYSMPAGTDKFQDTWRARNYGTSHVTSTKDKWRMERGAKLNVGGGFMFAYLWNFKDSNPEYFPMDKDGKRMISRHVQPCFTDPTVTEVLTREAIKMIKNSPVKPLFIDMTNEDTWTCCQCPECLKPFKTKDGQVVTPDDPAFRSTQMFSMLNKVITGINKEYPDIKLRTFAYIYAAEPSKEKINSNIIIYFAPFVRDDKVPMAHPINKLWQKRLDAWFEQTKDIMYFEYYGVPACFPRQIAETVATDLQYLAKRGGIGLSVDSLADTKTDWGLGTGNDMWDVSAQEMWLIARLMWNPSSDVAALRKDFCRRAYREAAPAMEKYFAMLNKSWHGDASPSYWNDLQVPSANQYICKKGLEQPMREALAEAESLAVNPVSKELVKRNRARFEFWMEKAKDAIDAKATVPYVKNAKDASAVFNSGLWEKAALIDGFKVVNEPKKAEALKTQVRLMHDRDNLYIKVSSSDPKAAEISVEQKKEPHDTNLWNKAADSWFVYEFYFSPQNDASSYYHICFNQHGMIYDAKGYDKSWNGNSAVSSGKTGDIIESIIIIPLADMNVKINEGNRIRAQFYREQKGQPSCSWTAGQVHQLASFGELLLQME